MSATIPEVAILLGDLHLTDGTLSHHPLDPTLLDGIEDALTGRRRAMGGAVQTRVILTGDVLDLLRSRSWDAEEKPWRPVTGDLRSRTTEVVDAVLRVNEGLLARLAAFLSGVNGPVTYLYGNHDRLLADVPAARMRLAEVLTGDPRGLTFEPRTVVPALGLAATHGHEFDPHFMEQGDLPPLGDVFHTELLNRFPREAAMALGGGASLESKFNQVYLAYPHDNAAEWLRRTILEYGDEKTVMACWHGMVERFMGLDVVEAWLERHGKHLGFIRKNGRIWYGLWLSTLLPLSWVMFLRHHLVGTTSLPRTGEMVIEGLRAMQADEDVNGATVLVAGHTHEPAVLPLGGSKGRARYYLNPGAWRPMLTRSTFDDSTGDFFLQQEVSYAMAWGDPSGVSLSLHCVRSARVEAV